MNIILEEFPDLNDVQIEQFSKLKKSIMTGIIRLILFRERILIIYMKDMFFTL